MKVKVLHKFTNKYTGEHYRRGDVLNITEERYREILSVGDLVLKIDQDDALSVIPDEVNTLSDDAEETLRSDPSASDDGFDAMSVKELREYADKAYKLTFGRGTKKAEMIETLRKMEQSNK